LGNPELTRLRKDLPQPRPDDASEPELREAEEDFTFERSASSSERLEKLLLKTEV